MRSRRPYSFVPFSVDEVLQALVDKYPDRLRPWIDNPDSYGDLTLFAHPDGVISVRFYDK